jgi:tetratricopeptide (TPR) repeat protein
MPDWICRATVLGILLFAQAAQAATPAPIRYFEGELRIEKAGGSDSCQRHVGKAKDVQLSWHEASQGKASAGSGWIVFAGGAPGKLEGDNLAALRVTTNYHDAHLNTPASLKLDIADGKITGALRETPATRNYGENMCYWLEASLALTEIKDAPLAERRMKEHAAWYAAHAHESRGDHHARYYQYADAAAAYRQAIASVDGILPETRTYVKGLLNYGTRLHADAKDYRGAAELFQRLMDITVRQSDHGLDDPDLYRGWIRLATYLRLAKRDDAIPVIERAARLEAQASDVDLDERLLRLRLQGNIYAAAKKFDLALPIVQDEVNLATSAAGPNDLRTLEAKVQAARMFLEMKDKERFEAAMPPVVDEIIAQTGEGSELARNTSGFLGRYFYSTDNYAQARPWLERAFRGYRLLADSAAQAIRQDEEAKEILAALLDIYIKQGIVAKDFIERVKAGQASLDDLPFAGAGIDNGGLANRMISPAEWNKLLAR